MEGAHVPPPRPVHAVSRVSVSEAIDWRDKMGLLDGLFGKKKEADSKAVQKKKIREFRKEGGGEHKCCH
jgi:hypothetical protein